jgi:DNA-binding Lrp family transcriptional regulator
LNFFFKQVNDAPAVRGVPATPRAPLAFEAHFPRRADVHHISITLLFGFLIISPVQVFNNFVPFSTFLNRGIKLEMEAGKMQAIVYIRTDPGKPLDLLEEIKKISGVKFAAATAGRFDIVARIEATDLEALGKTVVGEIQKIPGVRYTETSLIVAM